MSGRPATARAATVSALRREIIASPDGAYLGSEPELLARLGVSSPTLRQAARLLEQQQLLKVERGNRGGYFGRRPDAGATARAVAIFLEAGDAPISDVDRVAWPLLVQAARLAARSGKAATDARFIAATAALEALPQSGDPLELMSRDRAVLAEVLRLCDNAPIALFLQVADRIGRLARAREQLFAERPDLAEDWRRLAIKLARAVLEGDADLAALFAERAAHFDGRWLRKVERSPDASPAHVVQARGLPMDDAPQSLARGAADALRAAILAQPPGAFLGAEEELAARFRISRHTLRQAAAIAQHDGLLDIRRGVNGGYVGRRPDTGSVVDAVALYLELNHGTLRDLMRASQCLAGEACRMVVASQAPDYRKRLQRIRAQFAAVGGPQDARPDRSILRAEQAFIDAVVDLAGNRAVQVFLLSLYRYGATLDQPVRAGASRIALWRDLRIRAVEALLERDGEAATLFGQRISALLDEWL